MGPLLKQSDSTCARITFSGSGLVPLLRPEGAQKFLKREKNSICDCILRVTYLSHVCGIYTTHYVVASGVSPEATQPMVDSLIIHKTEYLDYWLP